MNNGCTRPNVLFPDAAFTAADGRLHGVAGPLTAMGFTPQKIKTKTVNYYLNNLSFNILPAYFINLVLLAST